MDDIWNFINQNVSAIFALMGALGGSILSLIGTNVIRKKDLQLRLTEKILVRRFDAHEKIIKLSKSVRLMVSLGKNEESGELARYPAILQSMRSFNEWQVYFSEVINSESTWLSIDITRELNLFQDYIINLREQLNNIVDEDATRFIGALIRNDFTHFSNNIEKLAYKYYSKDLNKLTVGDLAQWHKYPQEETKVKLKSTELFTNQTQIQKIINQSP